LRVLSYVCAVHRRRRTSRHGAAARASHCHSTVAVDAAPHRTHRTSRT
jgi:hypothetical protein